MPKNAVKVKVTGILDNEGVNEILKDIQKRADKSHYPQTTLEASIETLTMVLDQALKGKK